MWRFRVSDIKVDPPSIKDAWLAIPQIKTDDFGNTGFNIRITDNPEDAMLAETPSQAFFMFVSVKNVLEEMGCGISVEPVPQ
jgi:hypothetical protein